MRAFIIMAGTVALSAMPHFSGDACAQAPDTNWARTYGGDGWDNGSSVAEIRKGGYILTGATTPQPFEQWDLLVIRTDIYGDEMWARSYGGEGYDVGTSIIQNYDEDFVIAGVTSSYGQGYRNIYLIKIDENGDTIWTRTYSPGYNNWVFDLKQTLDSGYVMAGHTVSGDGYGAQALILKINPQGELLWSKTYGRTNEDKANSVCEVPGEGFVLTGYTIFPGQFCDLWLLKTDYSGDTLWTRTYGGDYSDIGEYVDRTFDGGFIMTGRTWSTGHGSYDVYLVKTDSDGSLEWYRVFGGNGEDGGSVVRQTTDGEYFIGGYTSSFGEGSVDFYFLKTDAYGSLQWSKTVGGPSSDWGQRGLQTSDGGYILVGDRWSFEQDDDYVYLVKLRSDAETGIENGSASAIPGKLSLEQNRPNPFNPVTTFRFSLAEESRIRLTVYDILGHRIETLFEGTVETGRHTITWDASAFPSGVYFARLEAGGQSETIKMVLLK
jgi:hypothetical protein